MTRHFRIFRQSPGLVAVATISLGLGTGVNATLYSVFRRVFLASPSASAPERLVRIEPGNNNQIAYLNFRDMLPGDAFEGLAAYLMMRLNLRSGGTVEKVSGMVVSPSFFEVLGVRPAVGRVFGGAGEPAAVVTDEFWRGRLNREIGAVLNLNGQSYTVVGVLAANHRAITGAIGPDVYVPLTESLSPSLNQRKEAFLTMIGRLRESVGMPQARAAITAQTGALERTYAADNEGFGRPAHVFTVAGLGGWVTRDMPMTSLVAITAFPFAIFGLVLLIACANVAGLLLARGVARRREIAIRLALGAPRLRVIGTLLQETLLLSALGCAAGLLLTWWLCGLVSRVTLPQAPGPIDVQLDLTVLFYALFLAIVTTLACGLSPALASTKPQLTEALKNDTGSRSQLRARRFLVVGQVALSTLLLIVSTLFLRSLLFIGKVDPGFDLERVAAVRIDFEGERPALFAAEAVSRIEAIPGVSSASMTNLIPLAGDMYGTVFEVQGKTVPRRESYHMNVGPNYFRTMGTRLQRGREFLAADRAGSPAVAIVNQAFVRAHALGENPLGTYIRSNPKDPWREIVGIVADSKYAFFGEAPHPIVYLPHLQAGGALRLVARTTGAPATLLPELKMAILELDRAAIVDARTMREATSIESTIRRLGTWLLGAIGVLGLGLALIGLYGVMSYTASRRAREIGIRLALGAQRPAILWMVLRGGIGQVAAGVAAGILISLAATRPLEFLMSGITTTDPWAIAITAALLIGAGIGASLNPARRAAQIDPMALLRYD